MTSSDFQFSTTAMLSRGIARIPHLPSFLPELARLGLVASLPGKAFDSVAGWGFKPAADRARRLAAERGVPYLALEDGFLRSLDLGVKGAPPLSLVADPVGIYYDAAGPSLIENLLEQGGWETPELLDRARAGMALLRRERLSKYNALPERDYRHMARPGQPCVLVVDQTRGDASVSGGLASEVSFARMMAAARSENPDAAILVKIHPDVAVGRRKGYLSGLEGDPGIKVVADAVNPWSLIEVADRVYTVTSQLGFEVLMAGKPVRCFGMPFYAGWGVTGDELSCPRRTRRRRVEEIFAVAYLLYARYVDPFTGERCAFEDTAALLADWKRRNDANRAPAFCLGMSRWKRGTVSRFLASTDAAPRFHRSPARAVRAARQAGGRVVVWGSREPAGLEAACRQAGVPLLRMEDGFLRSVGLGAEFFPAASLALDGSGLYYDPRRPSDLETLLREAEFPAGLVERAARLRHAIVERGITKYNVGSAAALPDWPAGRRRILVPGQVEDDRSILAGSPAVRTNLDLLKRVRAVAPDAFILYKPHPDVEGGHRRGAVPESEALAAADAVMRGTSTAALLPEIDEVHTMTSLVGFEALLRGKAVTAYGMPFYAGWGLTADLLPAERRARRLSLDELVAGALILYPLYVDPLTGLPCTPELVVERLSGECKSNVHKYNLNMLRRWMGMARLALHRLPGLK
jgi:capsular polysaccharide export protein